MNSERLQLWLYKPVPGSRVLQLLHEQALGQHTTVASWSREDVDGAKEQAINQADQVIDAAQDHADSVGEACRFLIQWTTESGERALRTMVHRCAPTGGTENEHAARADFVSPNAMVGQLLNHISQQQRVINGSIGAVLAAYERALVMQQNTIQAQQTLIMSSHEQLQELEAPATNEHEEHLTRLKTHALEKLVELGPDLFKMGAHVAANLSKGRGAAETNQPPAQPAVRRVVASPTIARSVRSVPLEAPRVPKDADDDPPMPEEHA
jgi:hypothetical protein